MDCSPTSQRAGMDLCSVCSQLDIDLKARVGTQKLGLYEELLERSRSVSSGRRGCGGCEFFCTVFRASEEWHRLSPLPKGWLLTLRQIGAGLPAFRLEAWPPDPSSGATMITNLQLCTEEPLTDPPHPHIDFKHHIPVSPLDKKCFDLVRSWAKECANHKICAKPAQVPLPKRVIEIPADLAQPCRLRAASHVQGHYVILSHCWGKSDIASKLKDSLISTFHNAIPYGELPKNFQDAIEITRCLGFRYLWIDALCISQDNAAEWAEEAPKMSSYYGLSTLMIAATVAEDSSKGILIDRHIKYSPAIGRQKEYCLRDERLSSLQDISNSALATRGWAAQERTLAPRILHYTTQQMIWECGNGFKFEASSLEYFIQVEDLDKSAIQPFVTNALQAPGRHKTVGGTTEETSIQESKRLAGWSSCVQNYTGRLLTFPSDKLYAISGVADILNHNGEMGEYLSGIWSKHFVAGLSWKRDSSTLLTTPPEYRAPSWSWASVDGAVFMEDIFLYPIGNLNPYSDIWTAQLGIKLLQNNICLQDPCFVYGTVETGSSIVVEGACITRPRTSACMQLHKQHTFQFKETFDTSDARACSCDLPLVDEGESDPSAKLNMGEFGLIEETLCGDGHLDFYLFLYGHELFSTGGELHLLMMSWVSRKAAVAKRVGYAKLRFDLKRRDEEVEKAFREQFLAAGWRRMQIRLV